MLSEALREILSKALSQARRRWAGRGGANGPFHILEFDSLLIFNRPPGRKQRSKSKAQTVISNGPLLRVAPLTVS
jgi:hypothetical protein